MLNLYNRILRLHGFVIQSKKKLGIVLSFVELCFYLAIFNKKKNSASEDLILGARQELDLFFWYA